ncbi:MAG: glycosyltransferase [Methanobrevibacter sp.]|jgi:glycosyltransferase involved in cell wall biosynthesis|nr:glycosyltransferase [Candidatus Methanoflexus mossambicus]
MLKMIKTKLLNQSDVYKAQLKKNKDLNRLLASKNERITKLKKRLESQKNEIKKLSESENRLKLNKLDNEMKNQMNILNNNLNNAQQKINKYSQIFDMNQINKDKISSEIENFKSYGVNKEKRTPKLIVSLTSFPERMYDIHYTLYSLLNQTTKPDELILWLAEEQFPNLEEDIPIKVKKFKEHGLTIKWTTDIKSYKKLIPSLKEYPNDIIVTADDDVFYPENWLEQLYKEYDGKNIVAHRVKVITIDKENNILPYNQWKILPGNDDDISLNLISDESKYLSFANFFTGVGGVLYPPRSLYEDILNQELFEKLAPNNDDFWFWAMALKNNCKIKVVPNGYSKEIYVNPLRALNFLNERSLWSENSQGNNDIFLKNIIEYYPEILEKLKTDIKPKVSVIIPVYNREKYLKKCLDSVVNQTLKHIEIICVNDGSTDNSLKILEKYANEDSRIKILNQENQGQSVARNNGMLIAKGEYIGFVDSDDWIDLNFYEILFTEAKDKNADIVRTTYKESFTNNEKDPELNQLLKKKKNNNEFLNPNDHSIAIWNAIYRKEFIETNNIYFLKELRTLEDFSFTIMATFYSNIYVPAIGTYYHWRGDNKNKNSAFTFLKIKKTIMVGKLIIQFLNNLDNVNVKDYLVAYKRVIHRYDFTFKVALKKFKDFDKKEGKEFFKEMVISFNNCKYLTEFNNEFHEPYFEFLKNNDFNGYLNYKLYNDFESKKY